MSMSWFGFWLGFWIYMSVSSWTIKAYLLKRKELEKKGIKFSFWEKI